eukprot:CAMPEP_0114635914 /NCGR_PEP_ID=MMETSP0168-20121206/16722_1 /TAXON_ID=95228 ORGANISM="Vannella sp., Strain DIVA3 517/6/12" /NCGR_SAMPLE_ID=MMETSP0168 /ASSEMBLY_ACC=CAM_ASM_000044 /LENGTH=57 /DNA_ID=CAMNT_0001847623 /DNA_START=609 /DNA_END=779 /DNA_ORIENTATION=+
MAAAIQNACLEQPHLRGTSSSSASKKTVDGTSSNPGATYASCDAEKSELKDILAPAA